MSTNPSVSPGRIVFGDDRSEVADVAWRWINDQRWDGWTVEVLEVAETELGPPRPGQDPVPHDWTPDVPRDVAPGSGIQAVVHRTATADPRIVLGDCRDADVLVVGPTGKGLVKRWLHLGSTTEWLLHAPPAPMVIARSAGPVRSVVVTVDGSDPAVRALDTLLSFPWAREVEVLAIGVYDGWAEPAAGLEVAAQRLGAAGIRHRTEELRGRATRTIFGVLDERRPQLVTVGARGRSRFERVMAGSTAAAMARAAPCNVLVVP